MNRKLQVAIASYELRSQVTPSQVTVTCDEEIDVSLMSHRSFVFSPHFVAGPQPSVRVSYWSAFYTRSAVRSRRFILTEWKKIWENASGEVISQSLAVVLLYYICCISVRVASPRG